MCERIWRQNLSPELSGLEKLEEAISLLPCYDLQPLYYNEAAKKPLWTSVVYDYRHMSPVQIQELGLPKKMWVNILLMNITVLSKKQWQIMHR